jgi:hypothetical protein
LHPVGAAAHERVALTLKVGALDTVVADVPLFDVREPPNGLKSR